VVVVRVDATDERPNLRRQRATVRPEEGAVAVRLPSEHAPGAIGPEDVAHPGRVVGVVDIDRVAGGLEPVEGVTAGAGGNARDVAERHIPLAGLAAGTPLPRAANTEKINLLQLHRKPSPGKG